MYKKRRRILALQGRGRVVKAGVAHRRTSGPKKDTSMHSHTFISKETESEGWCVRCLRGGGDGGGVVRRVTDLGGTYTKKKEKAVLSRTTPKKEGPDIAQQKGVRSKGKAR